ncbi:MAG: UMP kinase [Bacteroidales bacterium]|nr:UMP kinase [Bacteroidales bacterium]MCF8336787.1 UMP kinase [Bacteroidales bacterium]
MEYRRILLKLSGEALMGENEYGINSERLAQYAEDIRELTKEGIEVAIVIGGGNIYRGMEGTAVGMDRVQGDYMGMLATVINSMALQGALEKASVKVKHLGGLEIAPINETMNRRTAIEYLNQKMVTIISGGTGNPYFTTDSASALRAVETRADVLLKGTRVDGVYSEDPETNPEAKKYTTLTFDEAYSKGLKIMDLTAFTLCKQNHIPILVFDMNKPGNLLKAIKNPEKGTLVHT